MNIFELSAKIGIDTSEYDKGLDSAEKKGSSFSAGLKSLVGGVAKVTAGAAVAATGAAVTGITSLTTKAVQAYGSYEQLVGGVNKIFGESAKAVMENADRAFATAGMSANQYMETVTGFSASLIQSLGGDTQKAVSLADTAIRDMSDNANTFGTDIKSIMNAYQGFSKQNYTMLDNLKLGYGGTKSEMERLVKDAMKLDDTFKANTKTVTKNKKQVQELDPTYADVVRAINIMQKQMGIAGTTAKEASDTIQGTAGSLKGAWDNLIIGLGQADANLKTLIDNVVKSALQMANNIKPIALQAVQGIAQLIQGFAPVLAEQLPPMIQEILPALANAVVLLLNSFSGVLPSLISTILPPLLQAVTSVIMSLLQALPTILQVLSSQLPVILQQIIPAILTLLPLLIQTGIEFVLAIGKGLADNINLLMNAVMSIVHYLVDELLTADNIAQFIQVALQIMLTIAGGIIQNIPEILGAIAILFVNIIKAIGTSLPEIGSQIIEFIVNLGKAFGEKAYSAFGSGFYDLLVGIGKWITNINNKIGEFVSGIIEKFVNLGKGIVEKVTNAFNSAKELFSKGVETLKGLLNFKWELPKLKMPHFKVTGKLSLDPRNFQLPKVSVDWYKKAYDEPYLLDRPTIFGAAGGRLLGGGEGSGSELVVGTNKLMNMMKQAVGGLGNNPITINVYGAEGQDVRELAKAVSEEMQKLIDDRGKVYA